jgi:predicted pore-forming effector associated with SMODS systems
MHGYSTDSNERRLVPLLLAALAIVFAWLSSKGMAALHFSVPWWLDAPSSLAFYGALYALFDKHLWRNRLVRKLGLSRIPDLTGRWRGFLVSSFDGHAKRHDVLLQIFQSWTQISIYLTTISSMSRSSLAEIQVSDPEGVALIYQYQNQPLSYAMKSMHMHYGTAMLRLSDGDTLTGDYYAGRDRRTYGRLCCWRERDGRIMRYVHLLEMVAHRRKAS